MKPFRFRLASLLRFRLAERDARRVELAQALAEKQRIRAEQLAVEERIAEHRRRDRELRDSSTLALEVLQRRESHRRILATEHMQALAAAEVVASQVDACQQRLSAAECEFQAVERLLENRLTEHRLEARRQEAKSHDDVARRAIRGAA